MSGDLFITITFIILAICFIGSLFKLIISLTSLADTARLYLEKKINSDNS